MALMASKGKYVGGAFVTLPKIRERLWARVQAKGKPPEGFKPKPGAEWVKPGLRARVKFLRGEEKLRHASVQSIEENVEEQEDREGG